MSNNQFGQNKLRVEKYQVGETSVTFERGIMHEAQVGRMYVNDVLVAHYRGTPDTGYEVYERQTNGELMRTGVVGTHEVAEWGLNTFTLKFVRMDFYSLQMHRVN